MLDLYLTVDAVPKGLNVGVAAALVLLVARPKMLRGALVQGLLPLLALLVAWIW